MEAGRIAMTRFIKRGGKVWIRVFPDKPVTKKPAETRMGHGKGNVEEWHAVVKMGRILYEMEGVTPEIAREAMALASHKLRSEEHTSELQSLAYLVCRLLLEKKKVMRKMISDRYTRCRHLYNAKRG